jgi:glycolate oxidase FAD binding subunit
MVVTRPGSPGELIEVLATAARGGRTVTPLGGGRASGMGEPTERPDIMLSTDRLDRVVEHRPADLTITVEAGCRLEVLAERLREQGQFVALDPYGGPGHTVGGVLAAGWSGPERLAFGATRDQVLGLTVALPRFGLVRAGGRQLKNVSGYDMPRLHVGALGTLGVIAEVTLRVRPLPRRISTLEVNPDSLAGALSAAERVLSMNMQPLAVLIAAAEDALRLLARYGGPGDAIGEAAAELGWNEADPQAWEQIMRSRSDRWARIAVPPCSLLELLPLLEPAWLAEPGTGVVHWLNARDPAAVARARGAAEESGGSLVLLAAPPALRSSLGAWGSPPSTVGIMRRLWAGFDPDGTLSRRRSFV